MNNAELVLLMVSLITGLSYATLIICLTRGWTKLKKVSITPSPFTSISVIIPFRNEHESLEHLLPALQQLDYPEHLREFIFIDDHSTEQFGNTFGGYENLAGLKAFSLPEGEHGKKAAITHGIQKASGILITTLDADCLPGRNWLKTISSCYESFGFKMIAGPVAILEPRGALANFQALELLSLIASGGGAIGLDKPIMCNGANLSYEKKVFEEVEGFKGNEHINGGDDIFLMEKVNKHYPRGSVGFISNPEGIVYTAASPGLKAFLNQRFRWVAKSPAYSNPFLISTALIVLLFNLCLLAALAFALISLPGLLIFAGLFLLKCIIDFPILRKATKFAGQDHLMGNYIPFQFVYFFFISLSGILGNVISFSWKGRRKNQV